MLYEFIAENHDELIRRTRAMVAARPWPPVSAKEMENGVPLFLTQLVEALRREERSEPYSDTTIGATATKHGEDLLSQGFTVSQVVHDYGDVCQAITELVVEKRAAISPEEFQSLNRCLDTGIAEAVTEFGRLKDAATSNREIEQLGQLAHELRNQLQTAILSFEALKSGKVGITGSTGSVLGRSLMGLRSLIDTTLSEIRLAATTQRLYRVSLVAFLEEVAVAAHLHAEAREINLKVEPVDPALMVSVDPQLLASALMNLLQNAFKYTQAKGQVTVRTRSEKGRVFIEVEDECGGMAAKPGESDPFRPFGERRGSDRSGLGLGLSISRRAVKANGGEVHSHNLPGKGCIFDIELPLAPAHAVN